MATTFSAKAAIGSGFQMIRRKPLALLAWAGAYLVLMGIPYLLLIGPALSDMIGFYQGAAEAALEGGAPDTAAMLAMQQRMMGVMPVIWLMSLIVVTLLVGAIYRAVLTPQDDRFFYLRLGRQELWLALTILAFCVFYILVVIVTAIPIGVISVVVMGTAGAGRSGLLSIAVPVVVLAVAVAVCWVLLRLSMAFPMSFAQGRFVLFESWSFTKGHAWKMFLVALALVAMIVLAEIVLGCLALAVMTGVVGGDWRALVDAPPAELLRLLAPVLILFALVGSVIGMAIYAVMIAPWANIYRQLTADDIAV
jgi:hypothetical protein